MKNENMDMYEEDTELMLLNKRLEKLESLMYKIFQIVILKKDFTVDPSMFKLGDDEAIT